MAEYTPLTLAECARLALELKDRLEPASRELRERYNIELEAYARLTVLGFQLKHARQARGLEIEAVAEQLAVEPHAISSIENLSPRLAYALLLEYVALLNLSEWSAAWSRQNPDLIEAMQLV